MAGPYYVDATGNNADGLTLATAWTGLATALAAVAAGEEIRFVSSVAQSGFTWGATGTAAARITLVGGLNVGGVWSETGARAVLDPNAAGTILTIPAKAYVTIRNVTFRRATQGITAGGNWTGVVLDNCLFELNTSSGLNANGIYSFGGFIRRCSFLNNSYTGTNGPNAVVYNACIVSGNGTYGIMGEYIEVENSVIASNTNAAGAELYFGSANGGEPARHCVFYANARGAVNFRGSQSYLFTFNKWLSNSTAALVLAASSHAVLANNGWNGNFAKVTLGAGAGITNVTGETDMAGSGCVNAASGNFNNAATSEGLFVKTDIDGTNSAYEHMGLSFGPAPTFPAAATVDPLAAAYGWAGSLITPIMDVPALAKVAPSDTLRGVAGTMDLPAITSVVPPDTLEGVTGTFDEAARNTITTAKVQGGHSYKHLNADTVGTYSVVNVTIRRIEPKVSIIGGGASAVIAMKNASTSGNIVKIGGSGGTACTILSESATQIVVTLPAKSAGTYDLYVQDATGNNDTLANAIRYYDPTTARTFVVDADATPEVNAYS